MRCFEKISFNQFKKDIADDKNLYNEYTLPERSTKYSAGYDFKSIIDFSLKPGESKKIPLGVKVKMNSDEMMMLLVRSSMGFKYNIRMCNQVGIFESDYYNNSSNEGHAFIKLQNEGESEFSVKKGDKICQGIFVKFLTVDNEEEINNVRTGGIGSTS
ncbi:MAG: deoxyuridine 5'-triphosphate nucleotidohydrolase [Bacilli bacterium]|nr:deoxyuridine 5'-triphosphate nucleotidohydrolase [Bacilli bacterium]